MVINTPNNMNNRIWGCTTLDKDADICQTFEVSSDHTSEKVKVVKQPKHTNKTKWYNQFKKGKR